MATCEVCGNDYSDSFQVVMNGKEHTFDAFECAIHKLAPRCRHCECRVIGHGMQSGDAIYCSAHCAKQSGEQGFVDHR